MINFAKQIKFITQKRMLNTHSTYTEIFDKLDININLKMMMFHLICRQF